MKPAGSHLVVHKACFICQLCFAPSIDHHISAATCLSRLSQIFGLNEGYHQIVVLNEVKRPHVKWSDCSSQFKDTPKIR